MNDKDFFNQNPKRQARIRVPSKQPFKDKQRAVRMLDEHELQFRSLGPHDPKQRRVLVWKVPHDSPYFDPERPQLVPMPMLLQPGEIVEDTDESLLPLIAEIMNQQVG